MLKDTRQLLTDGQLVCVFPEGGITRAGQMQAFKRGALKIHQGTNVPIIPVYLDELWGSIFSFRGGRFFWKWPRRWPYSISIHIGKPLTDSVDAHTVRQAVQQLGAHAVQQRVDRNETLTRVFVRKCKQRRFASKVADGQGREWSGGKLLMITFIIRRLLIRSVVAADERYIGILLPPSAGAVATNAAISIMRRIAVNLNYTVSSEVMNHCIAECGIQTVLTSRRFVENLKKKFSLDLDSLSAELIYLEDLLKKTTFLDYAATCLAAYVMPARVLERMLNLHTVTSDDVLTVIFTSGSTGQPKGVMLTQGNIGSNIQAIEDVFQFSEDDVIVGVLPMFHSFGYTMTLWGTLAMNVKGIFHADPRESKQIGQLCRKHRGTVLLATPTFLRLYLRRCAREDFAFLNVVVAGAEKLPIELCDQFEKKFGLRPVEGYGATELSPLVSVNVPPERSVGSSTVDIKEGTVGRPIPGVSAKVVEMDTGEPLEVNQPGMLWIKGPNVMKGYLNRPDITAEVIPQGWYITGDVAVIDEDGFIQITGRESRFSKIGGEMVPHIRIEDAIRCILAKDNDEVIPAAVTAIPDQRKGERLIVIHREIDKTPDEICRMLAGQGLPNIFIPSPDSFYEVTDLPTLGSGKLDLKRIKQIACEAFGANE